MKGAKVDEELEPAFKKYRFHAEKFKALPAKKEQFFYSQRLKRNEYFV